MDCNVVSQGKLKRGWEFLRLQAGERACWVLYSLCRGDYILWNFQERNDVNIHGRLRERETFWVTSLAGAREGIQESVA